MEAETLCPGRFSANMCGQLRFRRHEASAAGGGKTADRHEPEKYQGLWRKDACRSPNAF